MKPLFLGQLLLCSLICGCASSERMNRLSGDVIEDYSKPKSSRLVSVNSVNYRSNNANSQSLSPQGGMQLDKELINIWPFFSKTNNYTSILWPMVDYDDYGFAIRPFFNKEGDDTSILFPLSSWNPYKGWVLNYYWDEKTSMFFPLFYYNEKSSSEFYFNILGLLSEYSKDKFETNFNILGFLGGSYTKKNNLLVEHWWAKKISYNKFFSLPLLTYYYNEKYSPELNALSAVNNDIGYDKVYRNSYIAEKVKAVNPNIKLPENVVDRKSYKEFFIDYQNNGNYPINIAKNGGFLPLFWCSRDVDSAGKVLEYQWFSLATLSWYDRDDNGIAWGVLPLGAVYDKTPDSEFFTLLSPLVWLSQSNEDKDEKRVNGQYDKYVDHDYIFKQKGSYLFAGLYSVSEYGFHVVKDSANEAKLREMTNISNDIIYSIKYRDSMQESLIKMQASLSKSDKNDSRIAQAKRVIDNENIKIQQYRIDDYNKEIAKNKKQFQQIATELNFAYSPEELNSVDSKNLLLNRLFAQFCQERSYTNYSTPLFFNKNCYYNGDYDWAMLSGLMSGEKDGENENTQILFFLYRSRCDATKKEIIFFPFVTIQEDENSEKFSFMWRLFDIEKTATETKGHILFIPFG